MMAAVMTAVGQPLELREWPIPRPGPGEVLVRTATTGLCGTDLHILDGYGYVPALPHILGHEPAGVVAALGEGVSGFALGDRVAPHLFFACEACPPCRAGRPQQCQQLRGILGVLSPGALAEYFLVPAGNLLPLAESIAFDTGGLASDAVTTAVRAASRAELNLGQTALVIGAGGVGQCLIQVLRASGICVLAADLQDAKLQLARRSGAQAIFAGESVAEPARRHAGPEGIHAVFDCVGARTTLQEACRAVNDGGRVVVIGEQAAAPGLSSTEIAQRELVILGSRNGTRQDMRRALRLLEWGWIQPPIAGHFALADVNQALDCLRAGPLGRVIVDVSAI